MRIGLVCALVATVLAFTGSAAAARGLSPAVERVDIGSVTLGYRVAGPPDARPLLLIMGFSGTMAEWDPALIDVLARTRRVTATPAGSSFPWFLYWVILPSAMTAVAMSSRTVAWRSAGTAIDSGLVATAAPRAPVYAMFGMPATNPSPIMPASAARLV